jgi:SAM-dependent methyltransferase
VTGYALRLSEGERDRYRFMAEIAVAEEVAHWTSAGITTGARVADVGCGPGAILARLADAVGPSGVAIGVDQDPDAVAFAQEETGARPQVSAQVGAADATGLEPGFFDTVMCRHVLAHNGGREAAIVRHLAALVRPGGCVYLVDVDLTIVRFHPPDPDLDFTEAYAAFHAARGNDPSVGLRLGALLEDARLTVERYHWSNPVMRTPPGMRPPPWAAREAMVAEGFATPGDLERWDAAFKRQDALVQRPWTFIPGFVAFGRRPTEG